MAQLSALITSGEQDFRTEVAQVLRASGVPVSIVEERQGGDQASPDVAVVDVRANPSSGVIAIERLRGRWPAVALFAVAAANEPNIILQTMRAGANEFFAWPPGESPSAMTNGVRAAIARITERLASTREGGAAGSSRMFTFLGAKGGAGTTTLAVNTALELARLSKQSTVIVDFNPFVGEVGLFLGVRPRFTVMDAVDNVHRLDAEFLKELVTKHKSGVDILASAEQVDRPNAEDAGAIEELIRVVGRVYDYVVVDVGSLTRACAESAVFGSDTVFIVSNPDVASIRNTQRLVARIGELGANRDRIKILLNRTSSQHVIAPEQIEKALGQPIDHAFPSDYGVVSEALNSGVPLTSSNHSELASQFSQFAKQIVSGRAAVAGETKGRRSAFLGMF